MEHSRVCHKHCYATLSHPSVKDAIALHNLSVLKLSVLVSEFSKEMATAHERFSKELLTIVENFRRRNIELKKQRPVDTSSCVFGIWENLLSETELDSQAHMDAAGLLMKNVYGPLQDVASHKNRQTDMLNNFRDTFEAVTTDTVKELNEVEARYHKSYQEFAALPNTTVPKINEGEGEMDEESDSIRSKLHNSHNDYILHLRSANRTSDEFKKALAEILEELEEIYIDTSNTINVAIESQALLLLTKANEQHRRYDSQLKMCKQVTPHTDISLFVKAMGSEVSSLSITFPHHTFKPAITLNPDDHQSLCNQLIHDRLTESAVQQKRTDLQTRGMEVAVIMKTSQELNKTLSNVCQRQWREIAGEGASEPSLAFLKADVG